MGRLVLNSIYLPCFPCPRGLALNITCLGVMYPVQFLGGVEKQKVNSTLILNSRLGDKAGDEAVVCFHCAQPYLCSLSPVCWITFLTSWPPFSLQNLFCNFKSAQGVECKIRILRLTFWRHKRHLLCTLHCHIFTVELSRKPSPKNRIQAASLATLTNVELCSQRAIMQAADRSPFILYKLTQWCLLQTKSFHLLLMRESWICLWQFCLSLRLQASKISSFKFINHWDLMRPEDHLGNS